MRISQVSLALILTAVGCSGGTEPSLVPPYDSTEAHATLTAALDAWKRGEARSLGRRTPPIRFEDDDCVAGLRLAEYEVEEPDATVRLHQDIAVILSLRDGKGNVIRREAQYQVATSPILAVLRSDR